MAAKLLTSGVCTCEAEPMGEGGLEGFNKGEDYSYQLLEKEGKRYYRVYHSDDYYETCGAGIFNRFFTKETENKH